MNMSGNVLFIDKYFIVLYGSYKLYYFRGNEY
jgi:hypothetical protein